MGIIFNRLPSTPEAKREVKPPAQPAPAAPPAVPAVVPFPAGVLADTRKKTTDGRSILVRGAGWILDFHVCNTSAGTLYLQLFDTDSLPNQGDKPERVWTLATLTSFDGIHLTGWPFGSGFCVVLSSTQSTLTIAAANSAIMDSTLKMK